MRVTLDGADGWASGWTANGHHAGVRLNFQQGWSGMMKWAAIINSALVGSFQEEDGVKNELAKFLPVSGGHLPHAVDHDTDARQRCIPQLQLDQTLAS